MTGTTGRFSRVHRLTDIISILYSVDKTELTLRDSPQTEDMVRADVLPQSPQLRLGDRRPLLRLTAPRLELLQHSAGRLPHPVTRVCLRVCGAVTHRWCRLVPGAVHARRGDRREKGKPPAAVDQPSPGTLELIAASC